MGQSHSFGDIVVKGYCIVARGRFHGAYCIDVHVVEAAEAGRP